MGLMELKFQLPTSRAGFPQKKGVRSRGPIAMMNSRTHPVEKALVSDGMYAMNIN